MSLKKPSAKPKKSGLVWRFSRKSPQQLKIPAQNPFQARAAYPSQTFQVNPDLELSQFNYELPQELIAQSPAAQRAGSRLLHLDKQSALHDRLFVDLPSLLKAGDLLVFNNTRVIKARLLGCKESGGRIEVLVERITRPRSAVHTSELQSLMRI